MLGKLLVLGWAILACPSGALAQENVSGQVFLTSQEDGNSVFTVVEKDGIFSVEEKNDALAVKQSAKKIAAGEKILFLGDLKIDSGNTNGEEKNDVVLTSFDKIKKETIADRKELLEETKRAIGAEGDLAAALADSVWSVGKDVIFGSRVTFEESVDFLAQTTFMGRIIFTDRDMAGSAVIKKDHDRAHVTFKNSYSTKPYVTVCPNSDYAMLRVANLSEEGFDILTKEKPTENLEVTWQAVAIFEK